MKTYTPEQAAEVLQLHPITIYRYLRKGKLHGCKIHARAWRLTEEDLRAFLTTKTDMPEKTLDKQAEWDALSPEERITKIRSVMDSYKPIPGALDRFLAEKRADTEVDEQRFNERKRA